MTATILIIEDGNYNRSSIKRILRAYDYVFLEAGNGREALEILERSGVDLILLDLTMPEMDGYEFLKRFRAVPVNHPVSVCVITGWSDAEHRKKAADLGADDFVLKPIDATELEIRLRVLLELGRCRKALAGRHSG